MVGNRLGRVAFREENEGVPRPYLRKGWGCAQWSGSLLLPPGEPALPLAPMADTPEFGTDTSSVAEHPPCSSRDGSICQEGVWDKRVRATREMGPSPIFPLPHNAL